MKNLNLILLAGILILSSCSKGEKNNTDVELIPQAGENFDFYKSAKLYNEAQELRSENYSDAFEIEKVERTGNLLNIVVSYQSDCETNDFDIVWDGILLESYPMQTRLNVKRSSSNCNLDIETKKDTLSIVLVEFIGDRVLVEGTVFHVSNLSKTPNEENADTTVQTTNK